jgi:hypothetical protein
MKFDTPYKITKTGLHREYVNIPDAVSFERASSVVTKHGIVLVYEINWETNTTPHVFTIFTIVINGLKYSASIEKAPLTDRSRKWWATHFIKKLISK